jgi:hypothetical protein
MPPNRHREDTSAPEKQYQGCIGRCPCRNVRFDCQESSTLVNPADRPLHSRVYRGQWWTIGTLSGAQPTRQSLRLCPAICLNRHTDSRLGVVVSQGTNWNTSRSACALQRCGICQSASIREGTRFRHQLVAMSAKSQAAAVARRSQRRLQQRVRHQRTSRREFLAGARSTGASRCTHRQPMSIWHITKAGAS